MQVEADDVAKRAPSQHVLLRLNAGVVDAQAIVTGAARSSLDLRASMR